MRALDQLGAMKGQFGAGAARQTARLLARLREARLRDPAELIRFHETVLFLRAYPQSPRVLRLADELLFSFGQRVRRLDPAPFEDPEISGIAGTGLSTNFSYEIAKSLSARHRRSIEIDWENYEHVDRLGPVLGRLIPMAAEDSTVEPHPDWRRWLESARGNIQWLLDRVEPETYDLLEIPLRWELGDSEASRSRMRIPRRDIFYHNAPLLKRSEVSIKAGFAEPKIPVTRLTRRRAQKILDLIVDTSAVRYRELYGFTHPDPDHVYHSDLGRGVEIFFFGIPAGWRLPLRAYHAGMFFKNGVPVGYVEGLSLFERMEVGFNLYYTFREGETAWLYARLLKLFRERLGVTCYWVDPYQLGHENPEAIDSGAFWFYRKLGFRTTSKEVERLIEREEKRIAATPGYRTSQAALRRLAGAPLVYGCGPEWDGFDLHRLAYRRIRTKEAAEEVRYLRMMQRNPKLRRAVLRAGSAGPGLRS